MKKEEYSLDAVGFPAAGCGRVPIFLQRNDDGTNETVTLTVDEGNQLLRDMPKMTFRPMARPPLTEPGPPVTITLADADAEEIRKLLPARIKTASPKSG